MERRKNAHTTYKRMQVNFEQRTQLVTRNSCRPKRSAVMTFTSRRRPHHIHEFTFFFFGHVFVLDNMFRVFFFLIWMEKLVSG